MYDKPNSHRFKAEQKEKEEVRKKVDKIVTGKVRTKKKGELSKIKDIFISEDITNVKSYVFLDILVPAVKKAISDIVRDGIDMILYGESGRNKNRSNGSYVSYRDYSRNDRKDRDRDRPRQRYTLDDIILDSRGEAEEVLDQMSALIENYGIVSVADLFDMVGITGQYTDNKYGWTNIRSAEAVRVRDGYVLKLPKPMPID